MGFHHFLFGTYFCGSNDHVYYNVSTYGGYRYGIILEYFFSLVCIGMPLDAHWIPYPLSSHSVLIYNSFNLFCQVAYLTQFFEK